MYHTPTVYCNKQWNPIETHSHDTRHTDVRVETSKAVRLIIIWLCICRPRNTSTRKKQMTAEM